jgi:hypothetical protein
MGVMIGEEALPPELLAELEGRASLDQLADDLTWTMIEGFGEAITEEWWERYPGW